MHVMPNAPVTSASFNTESEMASRSSILYCWTVRAPGLPPLFSSSVGPLPRSSLRECPSAGFEANQRRVSQDR
jgi:hypothetical protein